MPTANPYEAIFRFKDGRTDTFTVHAYNASDALMQAAVALTARYGGDASAELVHLAPPADCWSAETAIKEGVQALLKAVRKGHTT